MTRHKRTRSLQDWSTEALRKDFAERCVKIKRGTGLDYPLSRSHKGMRPDQDWCDKICAELMIRASQADEFNRAMEHQEILQARGESVGECAWCMSAYAHRCTVRNFCGVMALCDDCAMAVDDLAWITTQGPEHTCRLPDCECCGFATPDGAGSPLAIGVLDWTKWDTVRPYRWVCGGCMWRNRRDCPVIWCDTGVSLRDATVSPNP